MGLVVDGLILWIGACVLGWWLWNHRPPKDRFDKVPSSEWTIASDYRDGWAILLARRDGVKDEELNRVKYRGNPYFDAQWEEAAADAAVSLHRMNDTLRSSRKRPRK